MARLAVIGYLTEFEAEKARLDIIQKYKKNYLIIEDPIAVTRNVDGTVKINQPVSLSELDTLSGSWLGGMIGLLLGVPFLPPFGAIAGFISGSAIGAATGALSELEIEHAFKDKVCELLEPGKAAVFVLLHDSATDEVEEQFRQDFGNKILLTTLPKDTENKFSQIFTQTTKIAGHEVTRM